MMALVQKKYHTRDLLDLYQNQTTVCNVLAQSNKWNSPEGFQAATENCQEISFSLSYIANKDVNNNKFY